MLVSIGNKRRLDKFNEGSQESRRKVVGIGILRNLQEGHSAVRMGSDEGGIGVGCVP
jgi:hypothetical protein